MNVNIGSIGGVLAIVVLLLALLMGFGLVPFTAPVVAGMLFLLALARLV